MRLAGFALFCVQVATAQSGRNLGIVSSPSPGESIHVVAFGDWGYRGSDSGGLAVEEAIRKIHAVLPFHLGLTLGDNFYPAGVSGVDDPVWRTLWEESHGKLGIPFFATLGNHDYDGNSQAEIDYSKTSPSGTWKMPFRYYTFVAGPVQFFALDTDEGNAGRVVFRRPWSHQQAKWLDEELARSTSPWKIVYGHHPIFSDGHHGDEQRLKARLLPILKARKVDLYLCGHEHDLQVHENGDLRFLIVGGGGKDTRPVVKRRAKFAESLHGFLDLTASADRLDWIIRSTAGASLVQASTTARPDAPKSPERIRSAPSSPPR
jgi:tartrate-resistant acid phosphatase type 5